MPVPPAALAVAGTKKSRKKDFRLREFAPALKILLVIAFSNPFLRRAPWKIESLKNKYLSITSSISYQHRPLAELHNTILTRYEGKSCPGIG